jgi:hypothetical protein
VVVVKVMLMLMDARLVRLAADQGGWKCLADNVLRRWRKLLLSHTRSGGASGLLRQ